MTKPRSVDLSYPFLDNLDGVCELLLVRHDERQYVRDMTIAAGVNPPLSELGQQQAAAVGVSASDRLGVSSSTGHESPARCEACQLVPVTAAITTVRPWHY